MFVTPIPPPPLGVYMEMIEAVIKPQKLDAVKTALARLGILGVTALEVKGCGRHAADNTTRRGNDYVGTLQKDIRGDAGGDRSNHDLRLRLSRSLMDAGGDFLRGDANQRGHRSSLGGADQSHDRAAMISVG